MFNVREENQALEERISFFVFWECTDLFFSFFNVGWGKRDVVKYSDPPVLLIFRISVVLVF